MMKIKIYQISEMIEMLRSPEQTNLLQQTVYRMITFVLTQGALHQEDQI